MKNWVKYPSEGGVDLSYNKQYNKKETFMRIIYRQNEKIFRERGE